jgi:predicted amidophosphoribosyltransferase
MEPTSSTPGGKNPAAEAPAADSPAIDYYCPRCRQPISDPLACGDCASLICRRCGTPLEHVDELGIG